MTLVAVFERMGIYVSSDNCGFTTRWKEALHFDDIESAKRYADNHDPQKVRILRVSEDQCLEMFTQWIPRLADGSYVTASGGKTNDIEQSLKLEDCEIQQYFAENAEGIKDAIPVINFEGQRRMIQLCTVYVPSLHSKEASSSFYG